MSIKLLIDLLLYCASLGQIPRALYCTVVCIENWRRWFISIIFFIVVDNLQKPKSDTK